MPDWENGVVTEVAQAVQRSAFPDAYGDHEMEGRVIASTLSGHTRASMVCRLDAPITHTQTEQLLADLATHLGVQGTVSEDGRTLSVDGADEQQAWSVGQYLVAKAERYALTRVQVADQVWSRSSGQSALAWEAAGSGSGPTTVTVALTPAPA